MGCGRPEPSSPVTKRPPIKSSVSPPGVGVINPSESGVGPVTIKDLAQPIFKQCGNGEPGERPKDKPDGGQIRVEGEPILPPAGVPEGSLGATRKDGTQRHFSNDSVPLKLLNDGNDRPSGTCLSDMILDENKLETDSANNDTILGVKPISLPESVENLVPQNL